MSDVDNSKKRQDFVILLSMFFVFTICLTYSISKLAPVSPLLTLSPIPNFFGLSPMTSNLFLVLWLIFPESHIRSVNNFLRWFGKQTDKQTKACCQYYNLHDEGNRQNICKSPDTCVFKMRYCVIFFIKCKISFLSDQSCFIKNFEIYCVK